VFPRCFYLDLLINPSQASASVSDWEEGDGAGGDRTKRRSEDASDAPRPLPLGATPVAAAFLNWDVAVLLKHILAQQLAGDFVAGVFANGDVTRSVILGERNAAAMGALRESLDGGYAPRSPQTRNGRLMRVSPRRRFLYLPKLQGQRPV
jgi:hypothetical protein